MSPIGGTMSNSAARAHRVAAVRPQRHAKAKIPNTTPICCASATSRSDVSDVPNTLNTPASTQRLPVP